ncbi:MAG TPA: fumarylacetoacetate hydrolase family protein [Acidimicrobiales bacterium]|nr:fumarylacetoacetate hydrolase family protein [Acidimicrobiales bacterium]
MRLANLEGRAVIVTGEGGIDVAKASDGRFGPDPAGIYDEWAEFRRVAADLRGQPVPVEEARLGPPSPRPTQVFGIGLNYRAHAEESGRPLPARPATFTKFPTCLTGPFAAVELPPGTVDWEVELVVVIGLRAHRVEEAAAWGHVAGLTIGQDLSERRLQYEAGAQFSLGKSFPGFGPTGPWLVTPDELPDPDDLALGCSVDGETVQSSRTSDLIFSVPRLVAELSGVLPLLPGDLIFTGTPAGVGVARTPPRFLQPGSRLDTWIEGIGRMSHTFVASAG